MKGYTIQHSIDLLEKAVENGGGSGGASTAADVSYNNTSSHLTADDVQEAIDEVVNMIPSIPTIPDYFPQDNLEHSLGNNLYIRRFVADGITDGEITLVEALDGDLIASYGFIVGTTYTFPINMVIDTNNYSEVYKVNANNNINLSGGTNLRGAYEIYLIYRKNPTTEQSTRAKKK